ncbi:unnamed protein product [Cochlearia groenlandica]
MEPFDIDLDKAISEPKNLSSLEKCTTYDLVSAVKRQRSFYSEVLRARVDNEITMQKAVGRYKAFLYLIKRTCEISMDVIVVPTKDIDLIWHSHQLNPSFYYNDMKKIFGYILQHDDDIDTAERKGDNKIDNMFFKTTTIWEETFGKKYWKTSSKNNAFCIAKCLWGSTMEKNNAHCLARSAKEKNNAHYLVESTQEKKNARCHTCYACFAVSAIEKNGGCCNIMKNNANENAPITEVQNNVIKA